MRTVVVGPHSVVLFPRQDAQGPDHHDDHDDGDDNDGGDVRASDSTGLYTHTEAAQLLADHIARHPDLVRGQRVVELGCGLGLCGLVAARAGAAECLLTDGEAACIALAQQACEHNRLEDRCRAARLSWGANPSLAGPQHPFLPRPLPPTFQVGIGADLLYFDASAPLLVATIAHILSAPLVPPPVFLLAHRERFAVYLDARTREPMREAADSALERFHAEATRSGLCVRLLVRKESDEEPGCNVLLLLVERGGGRDCA